jgi:Ca2+-binding RTX toxin-like protein
MATLVVDAPDGIDGNGFSFAALGEIDFVNGQLVSSSSTERVIEFDDNLSVVINGSDLDNVPIINSITIYQDGDPLVTVHASEFLYPIYDDILAGGVAGVMSGLMSTADMWGNGNDFYGSQQGDIFTGTDGSDTINGNVGDDVLAGGGDRWDDYLGTWVEGRDALNGGAGEDTLIVPTNGDTVTGGADADRFVIANGLWIAPGVTISVITDFSSAQGDQIDLSSLIGGVTFTFIGTAAFSGTGAEVRYEHFGGGTRVAYDFDGDAYDDGWFSLTGTLVLQASDFIL